MTQDEIIALARQAGVWTEEDDWFKDTEFEDNWNPKIEAFAKLVAEKAIAIEREACAELRNKLHAFDGKGRQEIIDVMNTALDEYQAAIRARGQA